MEIGFQTKTYVEEIFIWIKWIDPFLKSRTYQASKRLFQTFCGKDNGYK